MERETINLEYKGQQVVYDTREKTWTFAGVGNAAVLILNPEAHEAITQMVAYEVEHAEERKAKEEAERKAKDDAEKAVKLAEWKELVGNTVAAMGTDIDWRVDSIGEVVILKGDRFTATVRHDDRIYRSRGNWGHNEKTDLAWVVRINFKDRRFRTLENAVKNADKQLTEMAQADRSKQMGEQMIADKVATATKTLADQGITVEHKTDWHHNPYRPGKGHETHRLTTNGMGKVTANADMTDPENVTLVVTKIDMRMTPDQLKRLAEFIDSPEFQTMVC